MLDLIKILMHLNHLQSKMTMNISGNAFQAVCLTW